MLPMKKVTYRHAHWIKNNTFNGDYYAIARPSLILLLTCKSNKNSQTLPEQHTAKPNFAHEPRSIEKLLNRYLSIIP
jgi:hypothetical protein